MLSQKYFQNSQEQQMSETPFFGQKFISDKENEEKVIIVQHQKLDKATKRFNAHMKKVNFDQCLRQEKKDAPQTSEVNIYNTPSSMKVIRIDQVEEF